MAIDFANRRQIESMKKLNEGGEAAIYKYDRKRKVIKLFHPTVDLAKKEKKVKFFISIKSKLPVNVIAPEEEVTIGNKFAAYTMDELKGTEDFHMLTKPVYLATAGLSNKDVLEAVVSLGDILNVLHSMGILVGDISDYNFQIVGKVPYCLDVDSWGVKGRFSPDAYTQFFTCPESYQPNGSIKFSLEFEQYNFAVLAFNILAKIHPFAGNYQKLSIPERMQKRISLVGRYKSQVKIPKAIGSWNWMSPQLLKDFERIFDGGEKIDILLDLKDLLTNMKYCKTHQTYYYSKYSECPICNEHAKIKLAPTVVNTTTKPGQGPQISIVFSGEDCVYILSNVHYLNKNNEIVHMETGRKVPLERGKRFDFSKDGNILYVADADSITIYDSQNRSLGTVEKVHKSNYLVKDRTLYYVDKSNCMVALTVSEKGNMPKYLGNVYNPIFSVGDNGKVFTCSLYPKKAVVNTGTHMFEVLYDGKINEYGIKYDPVTGMWLMVYLMPNGKYRTMVFGKDKVEYDDDVIMYNAQTLSNIDFYAGTIYDPADGRIIGTNILKNRAKEFICSVVDENSKLKFTGKGFRIYNQNQIYNFG